MNMPTHAALIAPRLSLASCVRAYLTRSTVGAELRPEQRYNHFSAGTFCSITWLLQGESTIIRRGGESIHEPIPALAFAGPRSLPSVSVNPGPVRSFMVVLIPDAARALAEVDLAALVNRVVPLGEVLDGPWLALALAVLQAPDDAARVQLSEAFLEPRWSAVRQDAMPSANRHRYWVEGLALRAATLGVGQSWRQAERRIKQWAGLPLRELRRLARGEDSFQRTRAAVKATPPNWSDIAADGGYADQSHLCRETRRITGLSPNELKKAVQEDEGYWIYRLWE